jgi:hypothetical protein
VEVGTPSSFAAPLKVPADARQELREPLNQGFKGTDTEESADHSLTNGLTCRRLALCELVASSTIQIES